uniref:Dystrobrevin binding protein 1b n=1 Tax=Oncorhynchus mykiss TaxID=8022 RepID=A0A8C7SJS0_ONCMY
MHVHRHTNTHIKKTPQTLCTHTHTNHTQQHTFNDKEQKFFEEAFQQDMDQYQSTGYLQISERRGPIGSFSSMEVNVDMLEQMDLTDMSDHESLDVFLHSGGEDNSVASPMLDVESLTTEITLQVPTQAELRHTLSSADRQDTKAREDEGGREDHIHCTAGVQSYETEVPPNTGLAGRPLGRKDGDAVLIN